MAYVRATGATITIRVEGLAELQKKLKGPPRVYVPPVRKALGDLSKEGATLLRSRATHLSGKLQKSIKPRVRGASLFAAVAFDPVASQGKGKGAAFRSGWAFDKSSKFKPRSGGMTTGWISQAVPPLQGSANRFLAIAAKETEAAWNG